MSTSTMFRWLFLVLPAYLISCQQASRTGSDFIENEKIVLNPVFRRDPRPAGGKLIRTNPPFFLIPLVDEKKTFTGGIPEIGDPVYYSFRLSQDEKFPGRCHHAP